MPFYLDENHSAYFIWDFQMTHDIGMSCIVAFVQREFKFNLIFAEKWRGFLCDATLFTLSMKKFFT